MDYASAYPWAKKELLKENSVYTTCLKVRELSESGGDLSKKSQSLEKVMVHAMAGDPSSLDGFPLYWFPNPRF